MTKQPSFEQTRRRFFKTTGDATVATAATVFGLASTQVGAQSAAAAADSSSTHHQRKTSMEARPPLPPFTRETAIHKVRLAEDGWNSRDAAKVATAYTLETNWRNRSTFVQNRAEAQAFLEGKWIKEREYRLIKELWAFTENRIAVRYAYEWHDDSGNWFRSYGNENWEFEESGLMANRFASINDLPITEQERKFYWPQGRRPDDHPSLSDLGLILR